MALEAVARVAHRGAASTDNSGDGAGLLTQVPQRLFYRDAYRLGPAPRGRTAICRRGVLPPGRSRGPRAVRAAGGAGARRGRPAAHRLARRAGEPVGARRRCAAEPAGHPAGAGGPARAGRLMTTHGNARSSWPAAPWSSGAEALGLPGFYVPSFSCRTIVYKALLQGTQLPAFYPDFRFPEFESAVAVFHQRYSTNTLPSWPLAQPFRLLAHNGEINTLWGNRNAMTMRTPDAQVTAVGRARGQAQGRRLAAWQRLREPRQCHGAVRALGPRPGAHDDDDDPAGVGEVSRRRSRHPRLLRVPPDPARAVGRPGGAGLHRRALRRRLGRPQRAPPLSLQDPA